MIILKEKLLVNLFLSSQYSTVQYSTVKFPTRIHVNSVSAIDNIFIDKVKNEDYAVCPFIIVLSD